MFSRYIKWTSRADLDGFFFAGFYFRERPEYFSGPLGVGDRPHCPLLIRHCTIVIIISECSRRSHYWLLILKTAVLTATDQKPQKIIKKVILPTITLPECQRDSE